MPGTLFHLLSVLEAHLWAFLFIIRSLCSFHHGVSSMHIHLAPGVPAKLYYPRSARSSCSVFGLRGTILLVHGFAPSGYDDVRIVDLGQALAASGYVVVVPDVREFRRCEIGLGSVQVVVSLLQLVKASDHLRTFGSGLGLDIVSACISAGFCIMAAAEVGYVRNVLSFGGHADSERALRYLVSADEYDSMYGVEAILLNFWEPHNSELCDVLYASLSDDHYKIIGTDKAQLPAALSKVKNVDNIIKYKRVRDDAEYRSQVMTTVVSQRLEQLRKLSPIHVVDKLRCKRIALIHGTRDGIVPPEESRLMYERLCGTGIERSLCITPLLNHGSKVAPGIGSAFEVVQLVRALSLFFRRPST